MVKDTIVNGFQNAPHRSLYHALGLTNEEQQRPMIGIVSSYNEIVPGHMNIDKIVEAVKLGVVHGFLVIEVALEVEEKDAALLHCGSLVTASRKRTCEAAHRATQDGEEDDHGDDARDDDAET